MIIDSKPVGRGGLPGRQEERRVRPHALAGFAAAQVGEADRRVQGLEVGGTRQSARAPTRCTRCTSRCPRSTSWAGSRWPRTSPGADVFLDKREIGAIGRTPYTGPRQAGQTHGVAGTAGLSPWFATEIDVAPGTAATHMITWRRCRTAGSASPASRAAGGKLLVDGKPVCDTPCRHEVAPGRHEVEVTKKGFEEYEGEVEVARSAETEVAVTSRPSRLAAGPGRRRRMSAVFFAGGIYAGTQGQEPEGGHPERHRAGRANRQRRSAGPAGQILVHRRRRPVRARDDHRGHRRR